jgi:NitT/TauT family transport system ATP-binding protein
VILECTNLSRVFVDPVHKTNVTALRDITLDVPKEEFLCLLGPSGCGKTTLLHMIAGFDSPTSGSIRFDGKPVTGPSPERGVVFQEFSLYPWKTVYENVDFGLAIQHRSLAERRSIIEHYLKLVGLGDFAGLRPHQLSGGMKQRVAIARTLAMSPVIMLMDEPFASLDVDTRSRMDIELLKIWKQETRTVLFVTHSIEEAVLLSDRIVVFSPQPGRIVREIRIDKERPRDLFDPEIVSIQRELREYMLSLTELHQV